MPKWYETTVITTTTTKTATTTKITTTTTLTFPTTLTSASSAMTTSTCETLDILLKYLCVIVLILIIILIIIYWLFKFIKMCCPSLYHNFVQAALQFIAIIFRKKLVETSLSSTSPLPTPSPTPEETLIQTNMQPPPRPHQLESTNLFLDRGSLITSDFDSSELSLKTAFSKQSMHLAKVSRKGVSNGELDTRFGISKKAHEGKIKKSRTI